MKNKLTPFFKSAFLIVPILFSSPHHSKIDKIPFMQFQESTIPGANKVRDYEFPNSTYRLIHIEERHPQPPISERKDFVPMYNNISIILSYLNSKNKITSIYEEGVTPEFEIKYNKFLDNIRNEMVNGKSLLDLSFEEPEYQYLISTILKYELAGDLFSIFNNVPIRATEDSDRYENLTKALENHIINFNDNEVMDNRENTVLEKIASDLPSGNSEVVIIFGRSHNFLDNVIKWNFQHPDKRYDLTIITPKNL